MLSGGQVSSVDEADKMIESIRNLSELPISCGVSFVQNPKSRIIIVSTSIIIALLTLSTFPVLGSDLDANVVRRAQKHKPGNDDTVIDVNLSVDKSDSSDPVVLGEVLTYTLRITNTGADAATSILVVDQLPANVDFVSVSPATSCFFDGLVDPREVRCNLGS